MSDLVIGGQISVRFSMAQAKAVIAGYCFGTSPLTWHPRGGCPAIEVPPGGRRRAAWAYRVYDCVPRSDGPLDLWDVLLTAGLNSRVSQRSAAAVRAVLDDVNAVLATLTEDGPDPVVFWEQRPADLATPPPGSSAEKLCHAWRLLVGADGVGTAIAHKVLHHKRPTQFPVFDLKTAACYRKGVAWQGICEELQRHEAEFLEMERWFADLPTRGDGCALKRLRLHDILLWTYCSGQAELAAECGGRVLAVR